MSEPVSPQQRWDQNIAEGTEYACTGCAGFGRNYNQWLYRIRAARFKKCVRKLELPVSELDILDVGSGTGFYLDQWQQLGATRLDALDFADSSIAWLARRHPDVGLHQADLGSLEANVKGRQFDVISAFDVLFHIVDDAAYLQALKNLSSWLKPGGLLILSENFVHHPRKRGGTYHFSRTLEEIEGMMGCAGLAISGRSPVFILMNAPDDSQSSLMRGWWNLLRRLASRGEFMGWMAGAALYIPERILGSLLSEGPSTEMAVCRKLK